MTPGQFLLDLWPRIQEQCPDVKFQLAAFENTPQNAWDILRNLGQNIDIVAGAFDQEFLNSRGCAGLELCQAPIRCGGCAAEKDRPFCTVISSPGAVYRINVKALEF